MNSILASASDKSTLLVVDDSAENLQILNALLKDDYKLKMAKSGEKALEIASQVPQPDLILLDVIMPGADGFEVCQSLKANASTAHIPVIFLTALNEVADETRGFRVGGADFITKPFNPDIVKARIKTHLELQSERRKSQELLKVLLPENVVQDLITKGSHSPEYKENVSVMFCDFVGFTPISAMLSPRELIDELSDIFGEFDRICAAHGATRIKTIGDAYMAATGLEGTPFHADCMMRTAQAFIDYLHVRNQTSSQEWQCRIGIHSGKVIAGIIGKTRFIYDIVGDDVNIAARVESAGSPMKITMTSETYQLLQAKNSAESIGNVYLKGKGEMELFRVN
ncbi:MAG: adenylate/guanylate cyclase domain-containing protein [Flavobacteriales bacterium]|jgi:adenylate cyclase